jgi:hypothetical protein
MATELEVPKIQIVEEDDEFEEFEGDEWQASEDDVYDIK